MRQRASCACTSVGAGAAAVTAAAAVRHCSSSASSSSSSSGGPFGSTTLSHARKEAQFPTTSPFLGTKGGGGGSGGGIPFEQLHYTASTEQPPGRQQRTTAEDTLWAPIFGRRRSRAGGAETSAPGSGGCGGAWPDGYTSTRFSTLHRPFMGTSTRFRNPNLSSNVSITREDISNLEKEYLTHSPPGRINDHMCIALTRLSRWLADRAFRERYIHRATMIAAVAPAAPAAAAVGAYIRMMFAPRKRLDTAPYVHPDAAKKLDLAAHVSGLSAETTTNNDVKEGDEAAGGGGSDSAVTGTKKAKRYNSYADELRGLFTQSECHAVHFQILLNMAEITPLERGLVLVMQAFQFAVFLAMFLVYPRMGFRLMAYQAEESSVVWTQMVNDIDLGKIAEHRVPELAISYWGLQERFVAEEAPLPAIIAEQSKAANVVTPETSSGGGGAAAAQTGEERAAPATPAAPPAQPQQPSSSPPVSPAAARARRNAVDGDKLSLRDVVLLIRSDEMVYRDLNHRTADALDRGPHEPGVLASYLLEKQQRHRRR